MKNKVSKIFSGKIKALFKDLRRASCPPFDDVSRYQQIYQRTVLQELQQS